MPATTLIPRRLLFGNPSRIGAKLSPDGRFLSWNAPVDGVLNIWVAPVDDSAAAIPVTRTKGRPIGGHGWSEDGRYLLFSNDENGDENRHVYAVDPEGKHLRDLTPLSGISAYTGKSSPFTPDTIALYLNDRDARWHDLYHLDVSTGERRLVWENTQEFSSISTDWHLRPRYASSTMKDGSTQYWRLSGAKAEAWFAVPYEDVLGTRVWSFNRAETHIYRTSTAGRDTAALIRCDWTTGEETVVAHHPRRDLSNVLFDAQTYEIVAAAIEDGRQDWFFVAPTVSADFALLKQEFGKQDFSITSQTDDDRRWIVTASSPEQPATYYLYDRDRQSLTRLFSARPELEPYRLAPMQTVTAKARDGLELVSYLTLPATITTPRPPKPLPMVLVVHGGPWSRDGYGYRADHQWLADRGYAVLSVNYRGSTGFGKAFIAASEKEHGRKMHSDLIDMVEWAVSEGIAQRDKVAIMGGSYGGYASFLGATFTPDVFCCAVPVVGITNLQTLLESVPPYWAGFFDYMVRSYGDPRTEDGRALLAERSPIHKVDAITKPMAIFHGQNDVRCKVAESDSIVAAMQKKGIPVSYVVYPDEGHGFAKAENRLAFIAMTEAFFAHHLGGPCEPMGTDLAGSSHVIRAGGADLVPPTAA